MKNPLTTLISTSEGFRELVVMAVVVFMIITGQIDPQIGLGMLVGGNGVYTLSRSMVKKNGGTVKEQITAAIDEMQQGGRS